MNEVMRMTRILSISAGACAGLTVPMVFILAMGRGSLPAEHGAPDGQKNLDVESIVIRDGAGKIRIRLGAKPESKEPGIYLYGDRGELVGEFAVTDGAYPELHIGDGSFNWRASLFLEPETRHPRLVFWDTSVKSTLLPVATIGCGQPVPWPGAQGQYRSATSGYAIVRDKDGASEDR